MLKIIDFYADWCGPCQAMKPIFAQLEEEYKGKIAFERVDVEMDRTKSAQYSIMSLPTFVLVNDDKELSRKLGAMPKEMLKSWIDSNL